ncbi:MAG: sporulation integral membrane protein YlbJ [Clostridia bacterium]|nr:sporulation integral membrane protein YlbJ [Clostridia bacterium]
MKFIKRNLLTILFTFFLIFLVVFSNNNLTAAKNGLMLWANSVVPSLLPFFIATELLNYTNIAHIIGKILNKIMRPLFNIPGEGAYAFIMGIISGYPIGAKIVSDFYKNRICTKDEAERMLAFTNNSGPLFIIGTVGILLFGNTTIGLLLFATHILSSITIGIILGIKSRLHHNKNITKHTKAISYSKNAINIQNNLEATTKTSILDLGSILSNSISKSISTVLQIGGFVVLFSVIISILNKISLINLVSNVLSYFYVPKDIAKSIVSGLIELTNGINIAVNIHTKNLSINIITCSFLLGFGGISVLLQVLSIVSKENLSIKNYISGKFLQGLVAALYTAIFIKYVSIFNFDIQIHSINSSFNLSKIILILISLTIAYGTILFKLIFTHKFQYK